MSEFTPAHKALLFETAETLLSQYGVDTEKFRYLDAALQAAQSPASAVSPVGDSAEPKPSEGAFKAAWDAYTSVRHKDTDTEAMRRAIEAAIPYIAAAKDADIATVIRDNDEKMAEIARLKKALQVIAGEK